VVTLAIEDLHVALGGRPVLRGIDAEFSSGGLVGVLGPNGAGKSTLARAMLGLVQPSAGRVRLGGKDIAAMDARDRARAVAYLPQGGALHWPLEVERLVGLGRLPHLGPLSRIGDADRAAVDAAMAQAEVTSLRHRTATELSGGELSRVLLARALAAGAEALIVDEPLTGLDPGHQLDAMALLSGHARQGRLVIAILHDLALASAWCDRLLILSEGRLVADGAPAEVLDDALLAQVYGIAAHRFEIAGRRVVAPVGRA
jgi:iron complex transport system ATP-binding protein